MLLCGDLDNKKNKYLDYLKRNWRSEIIEIYKRGKNMYLLNDRSHWNDFSPFKVRVLEISFFFCLTVYIGERHENECKKLQISYFKYDVVFPRNSRKPHIKHPRRTTTYPLTRAISSTPFFSFRSLDGAPRQPSIRLPRGGPRPFPLDILPFLLSILSHLRVKHIPALYV